VCHIIWACLAVMSLAMDVKGRLRELSFDPPQADSMALVAQLTHKY